MFIGAVSNRFLLREFLTQAKNSMFKPGVFFDTFQESFRNKMFLFFFLVSTIIIGSIGLTLNMDAVNGIVRGVTFFGNELKVPALTVKQWVESLQTGL